VKKLIIKALAWPQSLLFYFLKQCRKLGIRKKIINGQLFYGYKGELFPEYLNTGNAAASIFKKARQYCHGKGIDVGADKWPYPGAVPIQNEEKRNAYALDDFADESLDFVFSSHCLEHLVNWQAALKLWIKKIKPAGTLFLYLPHESMLLWRPHHPWAGDKHKWVPTYEVVNDFLEKNGMKVIEYNDSKDTYWSFHIAAKKTV
jgi:SAM-dependent methyltransferase